MQALDFDNLNGQRLGQYQLRELLGQGGMGAVFRAYQERLDREVAIKIIFSQLAQDSDYQLRFEREARLAASLEHMHIIPVYDYGTENDISYIVMRLLHGGSLHERVLSSARSGGMDLHEVARITRDLASALQYAHDRDVIHRDVKASNVMFDDRDNAILVDFGIARLLSTEYDMTRTGMNIGSPAFMAPEQWRNEPLSPAVDQYTLAILVYYMLTNRLLFRNDETYQWMHSHLYEAPTPVQQWREDLPPTLMPVLLRGLAKHPASRFPNVEAFGQAFQEAVAAGEQAAPALTALDSRVQTDEVKTRVLTPEVEDVLEPGPEPAPQQQRSGFAILGVAALVVVVMIAVLLGNNPPETPGGSGAGIAAAADVSETPTSASPTELPLIVLSLTTMPTDTPVPTATWTPEPSATMTPTDEPTATSTFTPTATDTATVTDTPAPTSTDTPLPTATVAPTDTSQPTLVAMLNNPARLSLPVTVIEQGPLARVDAEIVCDFCAEMNLVIQYDPTIIHVKALGVDPVPADWLIDNTTGVVQLTTTRLVADGWNDSPMSLRFYVRGLRPGTSKFDIVGVAMNDAAGNVQDVNGANGVVVVVGAEPTPAVVTCEYRVQTGDTLSGIAVANSVTIEQLNAFNDLPNQSIIYVGQVLTVPASTCRAPAAGGVTSSGDGDIIEVHDCHYLGNDIFEWYSVRREYDAGGNPIRDIRIGGPFTGPWRPGCPQGGGSNNGGGSSGGGSNGGGSNGGGSSGGGNNSGGGGSSGGGGNDDDDDGGVCVLVICIG